MNSSMIGKIEKARRYAQEPERIRISALIATFRGGNDDYRLRLSEDGWGCSCHFFEAHGTCAHIMAAQRILAPMLPDAARYEQTALPAGLGSSLIGKLEKSRRYAQEPERLSFVQVEANFSGSNDDHALALGDGQGWRCACDFAAAHDTCAHIMAVQHILAAMLPETARYEHAATSAARTPVAV